MSISKASLINKSNNSLICCMLSGLWVGSTLPFNHRYNLLSLLTASPSGTCSCEAFHRLGTGKRPVDFVQPEKFLGKETIRFPKAKSIHWSTGCAWLVGISLGPFKVTDSRFSEHGWTHLELRCPPEWRKKRKGSPLCGFLGGKHQASQKWCHDSLTL